MSPRLCTAPAVCCSSSFFFFIIFFILTLCCLGSVLLCFFLCLCVCLLFIWLYAISAVCWFGSMLPRLCFASALCCLGSISGGSVLSRLFVVLALYCTGSSLPPAPHCPGSVLPRHVLPWLSVAPALQKKKKKKLPGLCVVSAMCHLFFVLF